MKYIVILGDGMADRPIEALGNETPLAYAKTPMMDELAAKGEIGMVHTVPDGMSPGSDTANLSVLGYNPRKYYSGRSPLEALSIGVPMKDTDIAIRCNIVTVSDDDLPYEEKGEFADICRKYGVDLISLIAPTSENRIAMIAKEAEGFIYVVSSLGVTGTRTEIKSDIAAMTKVIRENTDVPCAVGFGISNPETAGRMAKVSDGAIVGSAIVKIAEQYGRDAAEPIGKFVAELKAGMQ